jgi:PEP-CTERM motif-containing protein
MTFPSDIGSPGDFSGGTVNGVTADTLEGAIIFSGSSFIPGSDPGHFGSGPVTFTGNLTGFVFLPSGKLREVFDVHLSGIGTVSASGEIRDPFGDLIFMNSYTFNGTATVVPEPASLILVGTGLTALAGYRRRKTIAPEI